MCELLLLLVSTLLFTAVQAAESQMMALGRYGNANCSVPPYLVVYTKFTTCVKTECTARSLSSCINASAHEDAKSAFGESSTPFLLVDKFQSTSCEGEPQSTLALLADGQCLAMNPDRNQYVKASITSNGKITYGSYSNANCTSGSPLVDQELGKCVGSFKFAIITKDSVATTPAVNNGSSTGNKHTEIPSQAPSSHALPGNSQLSRSLILFVAIIAVWSVYGSIG